MIKCKTCNSEIEPWQYHTCRVVECPDGCLDNIPEWELPTEADVKNGRVNMGLLKACFMELPREKQKEYYEWIYRTFDYCRIYN
jgi:hypothetical protein